jgi:hypothetical protein
MRILHFCGVDMAVLERRALQARKTPDYEMIKYDTKGKLLVRLRIGRLHSDI